MKATFIALLAFSLCLPVVAQDKPKSLPKDIPSLKTLAEKGDAKAQYALGFMYANGRGVPKDLRAAAVWCGKAAAQGYVQAQFTLGLLYGQGVGAKKNLPQAYMWLSIAAAGGHKRAADLKPKAAAVLSQAQKVKADKEVRGWLAKRSARPTPEGSGSSKKIDKNVELGLKHYHAKNFEKALEYFIWSAKDGDADAKYYWGLMLWRGEGTKKDLAAAYFWLWSAGGHAKAREARGKLWDKLTISQQREVNRSVKQWGSHIPRGKAPEPPPMVSGRDHQYVLGKGYGHVRIRTYGIPLPLKRQEDIRKRGLFLIDRFKDITGHIPPQGFHFEIYYYSDKEQYRQTVSGDSKKAGGVCCWRNGKLVSPIHVYGDIAGVTHEMVHAIQWAAYGRMPQFMIEGQAHWLGYNYSNLEGGKTGGTPAFFYRQAADIGKLAVQVHQGKFPSMSDYLKCENQDQWEKLLGSNWDGYPIGAILTDWLVRHHYEWHLEATRFCHKNGQTTAERSKSFWEYTRRTWPGGFPAMDKQLRDWIILKANNSGR